MNDRITHFLVGQPGKVAPIRITLLTNRRTRFIFLITKYGKRLRTGLVQPEAEFERVGEGVSRHLRKVGMDLGAANRKA